MRAFVVIVVVVVVVTANDKIAVMQASEVGMLQPGCVLLTKMMMSAV